MIEYDEIAIKNIVDIRGIIAGNSLFLHGDVLQIFYGIEGCVTIEATIARGVAFDGETPHELSESFFYSIRSRNLTDSFWLVRPFQPSFSMAYGKGSNGVESDDGMAIRFVLVVGTFH